MVRAYKDIMSDPTTLLYPWAWAFIIGMGLGVGSAIGIAIELCRTTGG